MFTVGLIAKHPAGISMHKVPPGPTPWQNLVGPTSVLKSLSTGDTPSRRRELTRCLAYLQLEELEWSDLDSDSNSDSQPM